MEIFILSFEFMVILDWTSPLKGILIHSHIFDWEGPPPVPAPVFSIHIFSLEKNLIIIIMYIYIAHDNQEDFLCALQELSYSCSEKDYVFKDFIKLLVSVSAQSLSGNLFHKIGAADASAERILNISKFQVYFTSLKKASTIYMDYN